MHTVIASILFFGVGVCGVLAVVSWPRPREHAIFPILAAQDRNKAVLLTVAAAAMAIGGIISSLA